MSSGILLLSFMNAQNSTKTRNDIDIEVQNNISKKMKRNPTADDVVNIFQIIELENKKIFTGISIDPVNKKITVQDFNNNQISSHNQKNLETLYDYGGIKLLLKAINKNRDLNFAKYLIINKSSDLIDILDILGSINVTNNVKADINKKINHDPKFLIGNIIDSENYVNLITNNTMTTNLIKEVYLQKIKIFNDISGEQTFKKIINKIQSNISYKDFLKFTEINFEYI